ncbi:hypothetical protein S7711_04336, partial [Stachybotrys chartarum IBT 7711]
GKSILPRGLHLDDGAVTDCPKEQYDTALSPSPLLQHELGKREPLALVFPLGALGHDPLLSSSHDAAMTAAAVNRAPTPRPSQPSTTLAASTPGVLPPPPPPAAAAAAAAAPSRRQPRAPPADPLSDRVTAALVRRTLCPQQLKADKGRDAQTPIEDLLPPLTSRNDVDLQLYAFLAIILRDFVQSWYGRITTDETFVAEVVHVIAHCTRALEQRFRKLDLEGLVLDEIPELLDRHVTAYRISRQPGTQPPLAVEPNEVYHSLHPLPYMYPVPRPDDPASISAQQANEKDYRQLLVQGVLALLLPTEDLENPCLTSLVGQIFSELIIGNVIANKAAQPWLLLEAICILCNVIGRKRKAESIVPEVEANHNHGKPVHKFFVSAIQLVIHIFTTIRFFVLTIAMSSSLPPRSSPIDGKVGAENQYERELRQPSHHPGSAAVKTPVLAFSVWACIGNLIELDLRMPWLSGLLSLIQHAAIHGPGRLASLDSSLDR